MPKHLKKPQTRKLNPQETELVLDIVSGFPASPGFSWPPDKLKQELKEAQGWGLWQENDFAAFVVFRENLEAYEITLLGTAIQSRGQGLMENLLKTLINASGQKAWWLEVHEENQAALELYKKLGFVQTGKRQRYYSDGKSALLMTLKKNS
jgi:[ribosomal protein S18]-alanine N-acetyltransferase